MNMKKYVFFMMAWLTAMSVSAQRQNPTYLSYIEHWKEVAVQNQQDYGIPASIIMAQALLESSAGQSELAVNANNHFGIKCSGAWMGGVYYHDDDSKGECFRRYYDAAESFRDHAVFLQKPRYQSCFEIAVEDYEGWAHRLRACGYATDKLYPQKLIKLIEDYRLDTLTQAAAGKPVAQVAAKRDNRPLKAAVVHKTEPIRVIDKDPEPPYMAPPTAKEELDSFMLSHPKKKFNGLYYVEAREGDTYSNVAFRLNVKERTLREHNDALGRELQPGDRIYLSQKHNFGANTYTWTAPGLSLWTICQDEGVQMEVVQKLNGLDPSVRTFRTRQKLYLRKTKE